MHFILFITNHPKPLSMHAVVISQNIKQISNNNTTTEFSETNAAFD